MLGTVTAKFGRAALRALLFFAVCLLPACKGPWVKEFTPDPLIDNRGRPVISVIDNFYLDNQSSIFKPFTITDDDTALDCTNSVSARTSDTLLVPATYMPITGTAPNCRVQIIAAPGKRGNSTITLTVTDGKESASINFVVTLYGAPLVNTPTPPEGIINKLYGGFSVSGDGGLPPYTYSISAGTLPAGLSLNASTGAVTGTPTVGGTFGGIRIRVTGSDNRTSDTNAMTINIYQPTKILDFTAATSLTTMDASFQFRRRSSASVVNASGSIEDVTWAKERFDHDGNTSAGSGLTVEGASVNLLPASENLETATYSANGVSVAADQASSPGVLNTADLLTETGTGLHSLALAGTVTNGAANRYFSYSVFVQPTNARSAVKLVMTTGSSTASTVCNVTGAGSVASTTTSDSNWTAPSAAVKAYKTGWFRCMLTARNTTTGAVKPELRILNGGNESYAAGSSQGAYVWGNQLEISPTPTTYIPSRNLAADSEMLSAWTIDSGASVASTKPTDTVPNGFTSLADTISDTDGGSFAGFPYGSVAGVGKTIAIPGIARGYTLSTHVKKNSANLISIAMAFSGGTATEYSLVVDTANGTYRRTSTSAGLAADCCTLTDAGNNFWRVSLKANSAAANTSVKVSLYPAYASGSFASSSNSTTVTRDISVQGSATFWGTQFEQGTAPSLYYKTSTVNGLLATYRDAETVTLGALGSWFSPSEGTVMSEVSIPYANPSASSALMFSSSDFSQSFGQSVTSTVSSFAISNSAGASVSSSYVPSGIFKSAMGFKAGATSLFSVAGFTAVESASALSSLPSVTQINFGQQGNGLGYFNGNIRSFQFFSKQIPLGLINQVSQ